MIGIGATVLVVVFLLVWLLSGDEKYDWKESYKYNKEQPYDNTLLFKLIKARAVEDSFFLMQKSLSNELSPSKVKGTASYIYVGANSMYSYNDIDSLLLFVGNGHDAFLSVNYLDLDLASRLNILQCEIPKVVYDIDTFDLDTTISFDDESWEDDVDWDEDYDIDTHQLSTFHYDMLDSLIFAYPDSFANLNLIHPSLALKDTPVYWYSPRNDTTTYNWSYFNFEQWCGGDTTVAKLGTIGKAYNFVKAPYGKGYFYIHLTPLAFTNYYLRDADKLAYAQNVFSHLPDGAIYWDEGSHFYRKQSQSNGGGGGGSSFGKSELYYILSQPASKWAFYTLLCGILLYIIFFMKRRQRIIPVIEPYPNTSIEYVQTVGGLYFMKNDHRKLADQQFKLFLSYLRNRYRIATQNIDEALIKKVVDTSKVNEEQVRGIFVSYDNIASKRTMSEQQLISFNNHLEYFYKNCK